MRNLKRLDEYRDAERERDITGGSRGNERCGAFRIPFAPPGGGKTEYAFVMASPGYDWEHVSVSFENRTPTWDEMCRIKKIFFRNEEIVVQYHPPESVYVNNHKHCLHLWRPTKVEMPLPPAILTGIAGLEFGR